MKGNAIERRIFVVGMPRSGTTLVQSLLAAHSAVTSFTESHFFSLHFKPLPRLRLVILRWDPGPRLHEFLVENRVEPRLAATLQREVHGAASPAFLRPLRTRAAARRLLEVLDRIALSRGKPHWVEKTPGHLRYTRFLEQVAGAGHCPHFIHVIRDGREAVASLYSASRRWGDPCDLQTCAARWNQDVALSLAQIGSPGHHCVLYEELTARPDVVITRLLVRLGLDWEPEILNRYARAADGLITPAETWKSKVSSDIRRSGTFETALSAAERDQVMRWLDQDLYQQARQSCGRGLIAGDGDR